MVSNARRPKAVAEVACYKRIPAHLAGALESASRKVFNWLITSS